MTRSPERPTGAAQMTAVAGAATGVGLCAWLAVMHVRMILSPAPQEMREGAAVWITRLLLEGRNPYDLDELPASADVYGIGYYALMRVVAALFGNSFEVHRLVSALCVAGAMLLLYRLLRDRGTDRVMMAVGLALFYLSSVYFVAPLARPDSLALLLAMGSLTLLFRDEVGPGRFAAGLGLALLALATKPYLVYPPFVCAAYIFLFRSRGRGVLYGGLSLLAAVGVLAGLTRWYPAYLNMTLGANANTGYGDADHLVRQTIDWVVFSLPLSLGLLLAAASARRWPAPDPFVFASAANAVVFLLWLGRHPGAHMTYLFHLVTPALIVALLPPLGRRAWSRAAVAVALPLTFLLNAHYFPLTFERFRQSEAAFASLSQMIAVQRRVLGSTEVAGPLALAGRAVNDSGQSEYVREALVDVLGSPIRAADLHARWDRFMDDLAASIEAQTFDLVVRSRRNGLIPRDLVQAHYRVASTVAIDFAWAGQAWSVDLWVPKEPPIPASPDREDTRP